MNFAVHIQFPKPAGDQLSELGAEVENEDFLMHCRAKIMILAAKEQLLLADYQQE